MKNKTTQGLGNKNLLSFPKHDSHTWTIFCVSIINESDINKLVINRKINMYYLIITRFDSHSRLSRQ